MRILFTGASSFTGYWFASELSKAGHEVTAVFRGSQASYRDTRAWRVKDLSSKVVPAWETEFGSDRFIALLEKPWDLFCHHAAEMQNYRSGDFDALAASAKNTRNVRKVLARLAGAGCRNIVLTGSVFEPYEGQGDADRRAFSPYGLSKHITFEVFRFEAHAQGLSLGKFVIPNPFGPYEEMRFTSFVAREWSKGRVPSLLTPDYVRDNIHVSLLAMVYRTFCERMSGNLSVTTCSPSGYVESQGAFAQRFAREIGKRLGRQLTIVPVNQTDFSEPMVRTNKDPATELAPEWSEEKAWTDLAEYYRATFFTASPKG